MSSFTVCFAQIYPSDKSFYYVANTRPPDAYLGLRTNPTTTLGTNIMQMPNGTLLEIIERRADRWWHVRVFPSGQEGWALSGEGNRGWIECCATAQPGPLARTVAAPNDPAFELHLCRNSPQPAEKLEHCSNVIAQSRNLSALGMAHDIRGLALMDLGRFSEAIEDFNFVIYYNPRVAGYYDNRQNAYRRSGRLDEALKDANKAIQLAPSYAFVFRGRANVYNDMGKYDLAVSDYSSAIQIDPADGGLFVDRGKILRTQEKFDQATSDFSHAIDLHGKWNSAYRERGLTYKLLGQAERAVSDLSVYNQLEPGDQEVVQALTELWNNASISPPSASMSPSPSSVPPSADELAGRERARAERLDKIVRAATKQLDYVAQFIREHPKNPKLLDYLDETAGLKAAVEKGDPDDIERKSTALSADLNRDQDYQQFDVERAREQKVIEARDLGDAIRHAQDQRAFLVDHVTKNPLASEVTNFLPLIKQIGPALDKPSLDQLQRLTGQIDLAIHEANLDEAFRAAQEDRTKPGGPADGGKNADQRKATLPETDKNRFLLEGDLGDVLALYNAGANAPHVTLNLRGQFMFADDRANVCLFGSNPGGVALIVRSALAPYLLKTIIGLDQPCDPQKLETYDIVVTQRGAFLKTAQADALSLTKQIENDAMRQFALISASDIAAAATAERAAVEQIATDVAAGARNGFGVILLKSTSPSLCVIATEKSEAHAQLILRNADKLTFDMHVAPTLTMSSAEDAFVAAKKAQCGAVYASAADLKTISEGLAGAGIPFSFSSLWITSAELDAKDAELSQKKRLDAQQLAERQQKAADEARLRAQRAKDLVATEAAQQAQLRAKYDGPAKAAVADIVADVTNWAQSQKGPVGAEYPDYAAWLAEMRADHWEIMTTDSDVQDYGTSDFKGRPLDTAFARVAIRLRNPILGEYKDACFVFGRMADPEFDMVREPIAATCDDRDGVKLWQTAHKFQSRWVVGS